MPVIPAGHRAHGGGRASPRLAGRPPAGRRPSDSVRYGRRRLVAVLICAVVAGGAIWMGIARHAGRDPGAPAGPGRPGATARGPAASSSRLVLQVTPAPYQLPAPLSRSVVLPNRNPGRAPHTALSL